MAPRLKHAEFHGRVGTARMDVTPPVGIYSRTWGSAKHDVAEGVHRPALASCLVFQSLDGKDELVFVRTAGGEPWRLKLADLTDVTEIRAVSALDMAEDVVDTAPDYLIKVTWTGGSAAFAVKDATGWISAIAGARM